VTCGRDADSDRISDRFRPNGIEPRESIAGPRGKRRIHERPPLRGCFKMPLLRRRKCASEFGDCAKRLVIADI
jgi:hypothetical protein